MNGPRGEPEHRNMRRFASESVEAARRRHELESEDTDPDAVEADDVGLDDDNDLVIGPELEDGVYEDVVSVVSSTPPSVSEVSSDVLVE
eukprot:16441972-Heterocapsa_arctica.AAC.1